MLADLKTLVIIAGLAHIALCLGSLFIPRVLHWKAELIGLKPLFRQMFWNYAAYIFAVNLFFGIISIASAVELLDGSRLAMLITGFAALYWIGRVLVQFFYFDRSPVSGNRLYQLGEVALVSLFIFFSVIYSIAFYHNIY